MDATGVTGFGAQGVGTLHTNESVAGNPRAGQQYKLGLDSRGRVVHIYSDGNRVTIVPHGAPKQALALTLFHQENQHEQQRQGLVNAARQLIAAAHGLPG